MIRLLALLLSAAVPAQDVVGDPFRRDEVDLERLVEERPGGGRIERHVRRTEEGRAVSHGEFRSWYPGGTLEAEGQFVDGEKVGKWETWHPNGERRSVERYRRGLRDGEWKRWNEEGRFVSKETFEAVFHAFPSGVPRAEGENLRLGGLVPHGTWRWFREEGGVRCEGAYHRGTPLGRWRWFWWDGGLQLEGDFERVREDGRWLARRIGTWTFHHRDGCADPAFLSGEYADGRRIGPPAAPPAVGGACLDPPPPPHPWPDMDASQSDEVAQLVLQVMAAAAGEREGAAESLRAWDAAAVPSILAALGPLDLAEPEARRAAAAVWDFLPRGLVGGALDGWVDRDGAEAARHNALVRRRWATVWELFGRDVEVFLALVGESREDVLARLFSEEPGQPSPWNAPPAAHTRLAPAGDPIALAVQSAARSGEGTTEALTRAVQRLVELQRPDGSWPGGIEVTAYALLALSGIATVADGGVAGRAVERGARWLLSDARPERPPLAEPRPAGDPFRSALTALALAESARGARDPALRRDVQERFERLIARRAGLGSSTHVLGSQVEDPRGAAWEAIALSLGRDLGYRILGDHLTWAQTWIDPAADRAEERRDLDAIALVLWARVLLGWDDRDSDPVRRAAARVLDRLPEMRAAGASDLAGWFHGAYALHQVDGDGWTAWSAAMKEILLAAQHEDGGWGAPAGAEPGVAVQRTALGALCLEVYTRFPRDAR